MILQRDATTSQPGIRRYPPLSAHRAQRRASATHRSRTYGLVLAFFGASASLFGACSPATTPQTGVWRATLDSLGGSLPFELEITHIDGHLEVAAINGSERISVDQVRFFDRRLTLSFEPYDSEIIAFLSDRGRRLAGRWRKRASGADSWTELPFQAIAGKAPRFDVGDARTTSDEVIGRWAVKFSSDDQPAVAMFDARPDGTLVGTFMTATGDYRYLAGSFADGRLRLSCFDGAHAFLFDATLQPDGTLAGDFWSRDSWHETWRARRDSQASLGDPFTLTHWVEGASLDALVFRDLDGAPTSLADPKLRGRARIIELFGSWCPNCNDAAQFLARLDARHRDRGLAIQGVAFELTGDFTRDAAQVGKYADHHGIDFPLFVAGVADKAAASDSFPALDRVRAYPTMIFLDHEDRVVRVHTGFSGPATGAAYQQFERQVDELLDQLLAADSTPTG